jgi:hyperosmotically inducible protein
MRGLILATLILALGVFGLGACAMSGTNEESSTASKTKMTDSELENAIKTKIEADAQLKAAGIDVDANAERNEATLSGMVDTQALRTRAVELARSASAGLLVTDKIEVRPREVSRSQYTEEMASAARDRAARSGDTIGDSLDDAWIHTKIVTKLIGNPDTPQRKVNVDVVSNVVTLRGTVDSAQEKAEAERVAKETDGVKSVKNLLKVKAG